MDEFFLPPYVHCCRRGDAFVFLDLKQDDYTLVAGDAAAALHALASELQTIGTANSAAEALRELVSGGLLTTDPEIGRPFAATHCDLALDTLLDRTRRNVAVKASDWLNFIAACTAAAARLRWGRLENTVAAVARRKAMRADRPLDLTKARHLTAVFQRLRGLFPANYLCLFDSLAMIEFLARYDVYPTWVFGIRLEPWSAHCWLQQAQFTFNEGVEEAACYTPIMAI